MTVLAPRSTWRGCRSTPTSSRGRPTTSARGSPATAAASCWRQGPLRALDQRAHRRAGEPPGNPKSSFRVADDVTAEAADWAHRRDGAGLLVAGPRRLACRAVRTREARPAGPGQRAPSDRRAGSRADTSSTRDRSRHEPGDTVVIQTPDRLATTAGQGAPRRLAVGGRLAGCRPWERSPAGSSPSSAWPSSSPSSGTSSTPRHPSGHGGLGRRVLAAIWRIGRPRRGHRRVRALAGRWRLARCGHGVGGAHRARLDVDLLGRTWTTAFFITESLKETSRGGLLDALYLSMVTLATLGFGDIVPTAEWLRVAVPLQAMLGFVLLTAVVTWVLQVYPALTRRRALAIRLSLLRRADAVRVLAEEDVPMAANLLEDLAGEVVQARVDLTQYAETYYFRDGEESARSPPTSRRRSSSRTLPSDRPARTCASPARCSTPRSATSPGCSTPTSCGSAGRRGPCSRPTPPITGTARPVRAERSSLLSPTVAVPSGSRPGAEVDPDDEGPPDLAAVHLAGRPRRQVGPRGRGQRQLDRAQHQHGRLLRGRQVGPRPSRHRGTGRAGGLQQHPPLGGGQGPAGRRHGGRAPPTPR